MKEVLNRLKKGEISVEEAERLIRPLAVEEIGDIARVNVGREIRKGVPEVILAEGKRTDDIVRIALNVVNELGKAIVSRALKEHADAVIKAAPLNVSVQFHEAAKVILLKKEGFVAKKTGGKVGILAAGTGDIPIAEEARVMVEEMGCEALVAYDVGVAGIHRLFPHLKRMMKEDVDVIIVVAGREGALPSVVAGLVDVPVIGVPTSIGYGFGEKGLSALMAMLQSCSLGLAVVNIDGGIPAGAMAALIANRAAKFKRTESLLSSV